MINHANCTHEATKAARAKCRRMANNTDGVVAAPAKLVETRPACICDPLGGTHMMGCPAKLVEAHCELCGSTDFEDLYTGDQGYSACCNEPVILY